MQTALERLHAMATRQPEATALIAADRVSLGYRDLAGLVAALAERLVAAGLRPGDRVALRAPGDAGYVVGLLAALHAGMVAVPLNPVLPIPDQHTRITATGARVVLVTEPGATGLSVPCWPVRPAPGAGTVELEVTAAAPSTPAPDGLDADDAMIMFTGGTTGPPKMVPWTRHNIAGAVDAVIDTYRLTPRDATVAAMPLFHGHGLIAALLATLTSGGSVLLPAAGRFSAHTFADDLEAAGATWFTAAPTIHRILLTHRIPWRRLRFIRSCSATLDPSTAQALHDASGAPVVSAFGMTESTHQATSMRLTDRDLTTPGLVGASTGPQIRILGEDRRPCPPDVVGEVALRGPTVVRGYLADPAATAATFADGWLHTGDLGSLSADGELTLVGRIKELIDRGGEKISPEHVEGVLAGHPAVAEVAVYGVADPIYGQRVGAAVVAAAAAAPTPTELAGFCRGRLAPFEIPDDIHLTTGLPHTAKGSVDRRAVAELFGRGSR